MFEQIEERSPKIPVIKYCQRRGNVDYPVLISRRCINVLKYLPVAHKYVQLLLRNKNIFIYKLYNIHNFFKFQRQIYTCTHRYIYIYIEREHPFANSPTNTRNGWGPTWELRTQSKSPRWVAGTQLYGPSTAARSWTRVLPVGPPIGILTTKPKACS